MTANELEPLEPLDPWDRQPDERQSAWNAFVAYRDMGYGRTYKKAAEAVDLSPATIYHYSKQHNWPERIQAYDTFQDRVFQAERAQALKDMGVRHAKNIQDAIAATLVPIQAMLNKASDPDFEADLLQVDWDELMKLAQASARALKSLTAAERSALGAPSEIHQVQTQVQHEVNHKIDDDQLSEITELYHRYLVNDTSGEGEAEDVIDAEVIEIQRNDPAP